VRTPAQIRVVAALAHDIWYGYYVALISRAQVDYMVAKFQMRRVDGPGRSRRGTGYFLVHRDGQDVGYLGFHAEGEALFLSKFYLQRDVRGTGTGRLAMEFIVRLARRRGLKLIWLSQQGQSGRERLRTSGIPNRRGPGHGHGRRVRDGRLPNG
jgi:GNAT superfamily N-acetyltransferase